MKKANHLFILFLFTTTCVCSQSASDFKIKSEYPTMDKFYRNIPVLADTYYDKASNIMLEVPAFLTDKNISFQYKKRNYQHEQLFADNVNVVRFLGGWSAVKNNTTVEEISKLDLAYRDETGKIQYRWNLIPARIDPLIQMGYFSPNIVLDNTPWCFPTIPFEPEGEGYGQCNPPQNLIEWAQFISDLCKELVRLYGFDRVNTWGFRLGTEAGGPTRFNGTDEQYRAFYKSTVHAINGVLPGAKVFPYNRAGQGYENLKTLLSEAKVDGFKYSVSPISTYSIARFDINGLLTTSTMDPDLTANGKTTQMWYDMDQITNPNTLTREIHEYGWFLINEFGDRDNAPGARGAAGNFHYIMNLRQKRLDKLFHWPVINPYGEWQKVMLNSNGFIFSVWDYCTGARTVEMNKTLKYIPQSTQVYKSVGFFNSIGKSYIMVSGYNMNRKQKDKNRISVYIPKSEFYDPNIIVSFTTLNDSTDHYRLLRNDLAAKSFLYERYSKDEDYIPEFNIMSAKGKFLMQQENIKYTTRIKENLTLKPFKGTVQVTNEGTIISFDINTPELFVLALEKNTSSDMKILNAQNNSISLYPNPVKDKVVINGNNLEYAEIFTSEGICVIQKNLKNTLSEIYIEHLSAGIYFIRLQDNGVITTKRFIKL